MVIFVSSYVYTIYCCRSDWDIASQSNVIEQKPKLTMYTKQQCQLCDELVQELSPFMNRLQFEKVDITKPENREYFKRYRYDIPVLHINGEFLCMHRLDAKLLDSKLNELANKS